MGHVKVIRRSMLPDEWTDVRIRWLRRMLFSDAEEITGWTVREGRQISDNEYEYYDAAPRPLRRGDEYFTPDGTAFLHVKARLPERFRSCREVRLRLSTASEMLVRVNGHLQGGIDPNRETMVLPLTKDGEYEIEIEGYNRSKPDDDRNEDTMVLKGCRQVFQGGFFCVYDEDALELYRDICVFRDMVKGGEFDEDLCAVISDRLYHALSLIDFDTKTGLKEAREYIGKELYGNTLFGGTGSVALLAHSHLDIAYYWRRRHAVQKNARTCLIQLELMDRYPFFSYTHTQAYLYETLEEYYPDLFERVREKVKEGRFEPVGGMYVESDCNIPSAESLARQFMYGQRYFRDKFGMICSSCWLPDVFGTSAVLPQILKQSGIKYYVSNKMSTWNDTNRFPHNSFIWRGLDGSEVYACVPPTHFITAATPTEVTQNWNAYQDKDSGADTLCMYGYGDGGSGVTEEMLANVQRLNKVSAMPRTRVTGGDEYLRENFNESKKLAVWDGELYLEMHRGTYTTKSDLKKNNRRLEFLLRDAELAASLRWLKGKDYPADTLRAMWKKLLINQFHDILPGSNIHPVFEDAMEDYREIGDTVTALIEDGTSLYNTLPFDRKAPVFIAEENGEDAYLGQRGRFRTGSMPAFSPVTLSAPSTDTGWATAEALADGRIRVSTGLLTAVLESDGSFASVMDENGREYVKGDFNRLRLFRDIPGNYDAWDILPTYREISLPLAVSEPLSLCFLDGETCVFSCVIRTEKSVITRKIRFLRGLRTVENEFGISWHEDHALLKAEFDCNARAPYALCDTGAGFIPRETNRNTTWQQARYEVCHHKWADLSETDGGVAVINRGKYGIGIWDSTLSLSLLRATCRPDPVSDRGEHELSYTVYFHEGNAVQAGVNRLAYEYNVPLRRAALPALSWNAPAALYLQSMKLSEDGSRLVVRLTEQDGTRGKWKLPVQVKVLNLLEDGTGSADTVCYGPFETVTLGVSRDDAIKWLFGE